MCLLLLCPSEDFEQDGEESENDPDILRDPINQVDLQVCTLHYLFVLLSAYYESERYC